VDDQALGGGSVEAPASGHRRAWKKEAARRAAGENRKRSDRNGNMLCLPFK